MTVHKNVPLGQMHTPYNWSFANTAARYAVVATSADVGKFARQTSDDTIWMLTNHSPVTWVAVGGAGGGSSILTSTHRVYVDSENGGDVTGRGGISDPYASIAFAASDQPNPTDLAEFSKEILFHVEPGTYTANITLPYRAGISIEGELVDIIGNIYWYQNPAMFFGHAGGDYGRAALAVVGTGNSPIRITGDIIAKNINPSTTVPVGDKYFLAQKLVHTGKIMNLAAGAATSVNESTGDLFVSMDWCTQTWGFSAMFGEHETTGSLGQNAIILQGRNSYLYGMFCGNMKIDHLVNCVIDNSDYQAGYPAGGTLAAYNGHVSGSYEIGSLGIINTTYRNHHTATFHWGKEVANPYSSIDLYFDSYSFNTIGAYSSFTNMGVSPYQLSDKADSVATDASAWSGNLSATDTTVQTALDTINALSVAAGGSANVNEIWVDIVNGVGTGTRGTQAVPYDDLQEAFDSIDALADNETYVFHIAPGVYSAGYTIKNKNNIVLMAREGQVDINSIQYRVYIANGDESGLTLIGDGMYSALGKNQAYSLATNVPGYSLDVGQLDFRRYDYSVAAVCKITLNAFGTQFYRLRAIKGIDSTPVENINGVELSANLVNCIVTGMVGGTWEGTTPTSGSHVDAGANPVYLMASNCSIDNIWGIVQLELNNCRITDDIDYDMSPEGFTSSYNGAIWVGTKGLVNCTPSVSTKIDCFFGKNSYWTGESFSTDWNIDEVSQRMLFDGDLDRENVPGYSTLYFNRIGSNVQLHSELANSSAFNDYYVQVGSVAINSNDSGWELPPITAASHGDIRTIGFGAAADRGAKVYPSFGAGNTIGDLPANQEYIMSRVNSDKDGKSGLILQADNTNQNWIILAHSREKAEWTEDSTVSGLKALVFRQRDQYYNFYPRTVETFEMVATAIDYANSKSKIWNLKLNFAGYGVLATDVDFVGALTTQIVTVVTDTKSNTASGSWLDVPVGEGKFYRVWFDKTGGDSAPASGGFTLVKCDISGDTTANDVASTLSNTLHSTAYTVPASTTPLTCTSRNPGYLPSPSKSSGLTNAWDISVATPGAGPFTVEVLYETDTAGGDSGTALWDVIPIDGSGKFYLNATQRYDANIHWFAELKGDS